MCKWRDSVAAVDAAADRLSQACEIAIRERPVPNGARSRPEHSGTVKAVRSAIRDVSVTPIDMATQLKKMK